MGSFVDIRVLRGSSFWMRSMIVSEYSRMQPNAVKESTDASASQPLSVRWLHGLVLLLLVGAAAAARFYCLSCKPFWFDEAFSVEVARIDWRNFLHLMWWREANMSLYYVLLHMWLWFAHSPYFIRSLSAVISAMTLPAVYWVAKLLFDQRTALIAGALFAINAFSIRYGQEARSYALFVLLATLSSGCLISFLKSANGRAWRAYIVLSVLAVYAHFYALLLIAAHWLIFKWDGIPHDATESVTRSILAQLRRAWIVIGISVLPLLIFVAKTGPGPIKWISRPGLRDLWRFSADFTNGIPVVYGIACLLALIPVRRELFARDGRWQVWRVHFLVLWLLFPILLTVILSFARPVFLARYMIFCIPAVVILTAAGLASIRPSWLGATLTAVVLLFSAHFIPFVYGHDFDDERDASGAATNFILDRAQADDGILFHIAETRVPYEFFRSLRAGTSTASPEFKDPLGPEIVFPHHGPGLDYRDFTGKPAEELVRAESAKHSRMWVMLMNNLTKAKPDPTTVMLLQTLPQSLPNMQRWEFARVEVRLYSKE